MEDGEWRSEFTVGFIALTPGWLTTEETACIRVLDGGRVIHGECDTDTRLLLLFVIWPLRTVMFDIDCNYTRLIV